MKVYAFIDDHKTEFDVKTLCDVCGVPRSSYYDWVNAEPTDALWDEAILTNRIFDVWFRSRRRYGAPRVCAELWRRGHRANHKTVERIMREMGWQGRSARPKLRTTIVDKTATPAADLVCRDFARDQLDQLWLGDITYLDTDEGWLYLSSVLDACSRRLVGWSITDHLRAAGPADALRAAAATRGRLTFSGTVFHSDRGTQYTSDEYRQLCASLGITQSMGSVGDSYDNAMAESLWASLKREVADTKYSTKEAARAAVFEWIIWYNRQRLHSGIGYQPPEEYEEQLLRNRAA